MRVYLYVVSIWCLLLSACSTAHDDIDKLFQPHSQLHFNDLVVQVQGYPVPTLEAFMGWDIYRVLRMKCHCIWCYYKGLIGV